MTTIAGDVVAPDVIHLTVRDESADSYSVRGLGLYLARGIVEAHGGVLTLVTAAGSGARFTFTLPPPRPDSGEHLGEARAPVAIVRAAQQTKPC